MNRNTIKSTEEDLFHETQIRRYKLDKTLLRKEIVGEEGLHKQTLFGKPLMELDNLEEKSRDELLFKDEIVALKRYCSTYMTTRSINAGITESIEKIESRYSRKDVTATPRSKKKRASFERKINATIDYIDLDKRISNIKRDSLELLIEYYIFRVSAKSIAKERGIDVTCLGGKISAARRELRKALTDIIVKGNPKKGVAEHKTKGCVATEYTDSRRMRAANFVRSKMGLLE